VNKDSHWRLYWLDWCLWFRDDEVYITATGLSCTIGNFSNCPKPFRYKHGCESRWWILCPLSCVLCARHSVACTECPESEKPKGISCQDGVDICYEIGHIQTNFMSGRSWYLLWNWAHTNEFHVRTELISAMKLGTYKRISCQDGVDICYEIGHIQTWPIISLELLYQGSLAFFVPWTPRGVWWNLQAPSQKNKFKSIKQNTSV